MLKLIDLSLVDCLRCLSLKIKCSLSIQNAGVGYSNLLRFGFYVNVASWGINFRPNITEMLKTCVSPH